MNAANNFQITLELVKKTAELVLNDLIQYGIFKFRPPIFEFKLSSSKTFGAKVRTTYERRTEKVLSQTLVVNKLRKWDTKTLHNIIAHELIHVYVPHAHGIEREAHGYWFKQYMNKINSSALSYTVTIFDDDFELSNSRSKKPMFLIVGERVKNGVTQYLVTGITQKVFEGNANAIADQFAKYGKRGSLKIENIRFIKTFDNNYATMTFHRNSNWWKFKWAMFEQIKFNEEHQVLLSINADS